MAENRNRAEFEACWAGDFVYMCEDHMKQLITVAEAMGTPINYKPYVGVQKCKNCENQK